MVLDPEHRQLPMAQSLDRPVVQVYVRYGEHRSSGYAGFPARDGKPVVLGRDQHPTTLELADRMVTAAMAIGHLHRSAAVREAKDLVPEADAEDGNPFSGDSPDCPRRILHRCRVSWTVREEYPVRSELEHRVRRRRGR